MNIPDYYDLWLQHDNEQEAMLDNLPECAECGCKIQDEYLYEINDEYICEECLKDNHRKLVEDVCDI